jgi:C-8 sterol isomerase
MGYLFEPATLRQCAEQGIDLPQDEAFDAVTAAVAEAYPDHVRTGPRKWIFNNAGGAKGVICLLHGSLSEYLLLFGSDIGTHGHSGIFRCELYDWVFTGEMWTQEGQDTTRKIYGPGSEAYLGRDRVKYYRIPDRAWMLEYARGPIPTMLPFGLADSLTSTLDLRAFSQTLFTYGRLCVGSLLKGKI